MKLIYTLLFASLVTFARAQSCEVNILDVDGKPLEYNKEYYIISDGDENRGMTFENFYDVRSASKWDYLLATNDANRNGTANVFTVTGRSASPYVRACDQSIIYMAQSNYKEYNYWKIDKRGDNSNSELINSIYLDKYPGSLFRVEPVENSRKNRLYFKSGDSNVYLALRRSHQSKLWAYFVAKSASEATTFSFRPLTRETEEDAKSHAFSVDVKEVEEKQLCNFNSYSNPSKLGYAVMEFAKGKTEVGAMCVDSGTTYFVSVSDKATTQYFVTPMDHDYCKSKLGSTQSVNQDSSVILVNGCLKGMSYFYKDSNNKTYFANMKFGRSFFNPPTLSRPKKDGGLVEQGTHSGLTPTAWSYQKDQQCWRAKATVSVRMDCIISNHLSNDADEAQMKQCMDAKFYPATHTESIDNSFRRFGANELPSCLKNLFKN
ncbi:uncharacterized protein VTP21DRAFT_7572 [Calcarisporiella thermophila]|uniref:uncharacterized protein n=1 Tax=Calcarisporiella thermophila TaxID=911321 RepID=UPI0037438CA2